MLRKIAQKFRAVALGATVVMACAGQAHGATIVGSWDPIFGKLLPSLGWEGDVIFFVPDECLKLTGQNNINKENACNETAEGPMRLISAHVDLYEAPSGPIEGWLDFFWTEAASFITVDVDSSGMVSGLNADFAQFLEVQPGPLTYAGGTGAKFNLSFRDNCAYLEYQPAGQNGGAQPSDPCESVDSFLKFSFFGASTVPEPGSLALLLPAAAMMVAVRRRKRTAGA